MQNAQTKETYEMSHEGPLFYLDNTLVSLEDGCRVLGPYDKGTMERKRQAYEHLMSIITCGVGETEMKEFMRRHPLVAYQVEVDTALRTKVVITPMEL